MLIGAGVGVAVALADVPFLAGAGHTLADTALSLVRGGGHRVVQGLSATGAGASIVLGVEAALAVLAPGITALLLVLAARGTLRLRAVAAVVVAVLGVASFFYHPAGVAAGTVTLALVIAAICVLATGPLVAGPLAGLAGLIGGTYLPRLWHRNGVGHSAIDAMHRAITGAPGAPVALRIGMLLLAMVPFAFALRYLFRR